MNIAEFFTSFFKSFMSIITTILIALGLIKPAPSTPEPAQTAVYTLNVCEDGCSTVEGGCCDGRYVYTALIDSSKKAKNGDEVPCHIVKIDTLTWKTVLISEKLLIDHANDMTYNSDTDKIIVSNNIPNYTTVTIINPETLKTEETKTIPEKIYSIVYVGEEDCYYCGISNQYNYVVFDSEFNIIERFNGEDLKNDDSKYTRQSISSDGEYIYSLFYNPNCIYRYDINGTYAGNTTLPVQDDEAEFIFILNDTIYIGSNTVGSKTTGGTIYKLENLVFGN